jgi:ribose transport system ATP-binding protein
MAMTGAAIAAPYLALRGISKSYPGVRALDAVDFDVRPGEVHALVGENGAGKSTLVNILSGAVRADAGTIEVEGRVVSIASPRQSEALGLAVIHQEFNLVPELPAAANVLLGHEPTRGLVIDEPEMRARAAALFARLGVSVPPTAPVRILSVAQQQMIEIAKALSVDARVIFMDEPSAALTGEDVERLFGIIRSLTAEGVGIVYISHRLEEVFEIADRITVVRDGRVIETRVTKDFTSDTVIHLMVGRELDAHYPQLPPEPARTAPVLSVRGLTTPGRIEDVNVDLYAGEIYGIAGLVGSGRTSLLRAICGADRFASGSVALAGTALHLAGPHDAIEAGLALVTEDRKAQGLILGMSIRENVTLPHLEKFTRYGVVERKIETEAVANVAAELGIRARSIEQPVRSLSGGNQQKVVLAKWLLERATVICFDEPTRGIDVGAKAEIYELMVELAKSGTGIIMVSSELPEVLGMSMRIGVMRGGRIVKEFARGEATPETVIRLATGSA